MEVKEQTNLLEIFFRNSKSKYERIRNTKVTCAVIGQSGSGKSTLINAIFGDQICPTGPVETTLEKEGPFEKNGLSFFDLPGCGTQKFPKETYSEIMDLKSFDCLILVTANRFYQNDIFLIQEANRLDKPVFIVRTKIDQAIADGKHDFPIKEEKDVINICLHDIESSISELKNNGIYLVSSRKPTEYDLPQLLKKIADSLSSIKRKKFISQIFGASEDIINEKRKIAKKTVRYYSAAAALNGLNPIPGLDISIDLGLILKMNQEILKIFNLDEESIEYLTYLKFSQAAVNSIRRFSLGFITKESVLILLKKYLPQVVAKQITKYIPLIGQITGVFLGFGLTMYFGNKTIEECAGKAKEILNQVNENSFE